MPAISGVIIFYRYCLAENRIRVEPVRHNNTFRPGSVPAVCPSAWPNHGILSAIPGIPNSECTRFFYGRQPRPRLYDC